MKHERLDIVVLGLSITSSWGNGHATTYRALLKELWRHGHKILFLECDAPWYRDHRDLASADYCDIELYAGLDELQAKYASRIRKADVIILGSYVPDGIAVGKWVVQQAKGLRVFYDIDTPVTLAGVNDKTCPYLAPELVPSYDLYLSFTGGPTLAVIERTLKSPAARFLPCSVDPSAYYVEEGTRFEWDLGYLGTYSADRQAKLAALLVEPARQLTERCFAVAGPLYPDTLEWPANVWRTDHLPPDEHRHFYNSQRFTLNVTRQDMVFAGFSPSVRLFEAAACGTVIVSDYWTGLETYFELGFEILVAENTEQACHILRNLRADQRQAIGYRARMRVLKEHTSSRRALQLESYLFERLEQKAAASQSVLVKA